MFFFTFLGNALLMAGGLGWLLFHLRPMAALITVTMGSARRRLGSDVVEDRLLVGDLDGVGAAAVAAWLWVRRARSNAAAAGRRPNGEASAL